MYNNDRFSVVNAGEADFLGRLRKLSLQGLASFDRVLMFGWMCLRKAFGERG
jgi:hypothetical protein